MIDTAGNLGHIFDQAYICGGVKWINAIQILMAAIEINARKYRRGNPKWTIQRNWQHSAHKRKKIKTKRQ
jgi:hypothetical protein